MPLVSTTTGPSPPAHQAYIPSPLATLGFTAIAPPAQTLVMHMFPRADVPLTLLCMLAAVAMSPELAKAWPR